METNNHAAHLNHAPASILTSILQISLQSILKWGWHVTDGETKVHVDKMIFLSEQQVEKRENVLFFFF